MTFSFLISRPHTTFSGLFGVQGGDLECSSQLDEVEPPSFTPPDSPLQVKKPPRIYPNHP